MRRMLRFIVSGTLVGLGVASVAAAVVPAAEEDDSFDIICVLCEQWQVESTGQWFHQDTSWWFPDKQGYAAHYSPVQSTCAVHTPYMQGGSGGKPPVK